jgi:hypothetical protein
MDYDEKLPVYYKNNYEFFSRYLPHVKHKKDNGLLEKAKIRWFSFEDLKRERTSFRSFYQNIVDLIIKQEKQITEKMIIVKMKQTNPVKVNKSKKVKHGYRNHNTRKNKKKL